jgi:hypothetical protein
MEMIPRRNLLVASLLATAATSLRGQSVEAAGVDASMTQVVQADAIPWKQLYNFRMVQPSRRRCTAWWASPDSISC